MYGTWHLEQKVFPPLEAAQAADCHSQLLHTSGKKNVRDDDHARRLNQEVHRNTVAFVKDAKDEKEFTDIKLYLIQNNNFHLHILFTLTVEADSILKRYRHLKATEDRRARDDRRVKCFQGKKVHETISEIIKGKGLAPIGFLKRQHDAGLGKPKGSYTTDPIEIDAIVDRAWSAITFGNSNDNDKLAEAFMNKYDEYIVKAREFKVAKLDVHSFKAACLCSHGSAGGLDGWNALDMTLFSDKAFQVLVDLLNCIEEDAPWPKAMGDVRAVFLSEDANDTANPLVYRILKITSAIYRKRATTRLRDLEGWIAQWDDEALHAGTLFEGAQDAWGKSAIELELLELMGIKLCGGSIDVFKWFGQLVRELIY